MEESTGERGTQLRVGAMTYLDDIIRYDMDHAQTQRIALEVEHGRHLTKQIDSDQTLGLLETLANFDYYRGNYALAKQDWQRLKDHTEELLGADHPATLTSMNDLAVTLLILGDHSGAKQHQEHVVEHGKALLGVDHPDATYSAWNLFKLLHQLEKHGAAKQVIDTHLRWLLEDKVELHDAGQRQIRDMLKKFVEQG